MGAIEGIERLLQPLIPAAVQVDDRPDPRGIHHSQVLAHSLGRQRLLAPAQMGVDIDDRELRPGDVGLLDPQHRPGLPVAEFEVAQIVGDLGARPGSE
jgi:hypothetical protein